MAANQECVVCAETQEATAFPGTPLTSDCEHSPGTCMGCVSKAIRAHLEHESSVKVPCPECAGILPPGTVSLYADPATRQRYDEVCLRQLMQEDGNFVWCAAGCGSGQLHDGGIDEPIVKCAGCGIKTCFFCKVQWHAGMTCDEWNSLLVPGSAAGDSEASTQELLRRARELRATKEVIDQTTKPCPKCKWNIEKAGGW